MTPPEDASPFDDVPLQWSEQTRARYLAHMDALVDELRRHARLVAGLDEEHLHHDPDTRATFFTSHDLVDRAIRQAAESELDWSGTASLPFVDVPDVADLDSLDGLDSVDGFDGLFADLDEEADEPGQVVSLVGRWDVEIVDAPALLAAGRAAYAELHDLSDPTLAELSVTTALQAAEALLESPGFPELEVEGATVPLGAFWTFVQHTEPLADPGLGPAGDPFDIIRGDED